MTHNPFTAISVVLDVAEAEAIERAATIREVTVAEFVRRSAVTFAVMTNDDNDKEQAL